MDSVRMNSGLAVTEDHWKWQHSIDCMRVPTATPQ